MYCSVILSVFVATNILTTTSVESKLDIVMIKIDFVSYIRSSPNGPFSHSRSEHAQINNMSCGQIMCANTEYELMVLQSAIIMLHTTLLGML